MAAQALRFSREGSSIGFQFSGGILDFMVLAILRKGDAYGYVLTQRAKELMDLSDSTLYPILRRLQKEGALITYDQPFQGRNRRYYSLTGQGQQMLAGYVKEWNRYKGQIDRILADDGTSPEESTSSDADGSARKCEERIMNNGTVDD